MYTPNSSIRRQRSWNSLSTTTQRLVIVLSLAGLGGSFVVSCGSSDSNAGGNTGDDGGSGTTSGSGGGSGTGTSNGTASGSGSGGKGGSGGNGSNSGGGSNGSGSGSGMGSSGGSGSGSGGNGSGSNSGSGSGGSSGASSTGGSSGSKDGGTSSSGSDATVPGDAAVACTNTDMTKINIDASGWICNNQWGIQGAWYCYNDGMDSGNSCKGTDGKGNTAIPWNASSSAMCISGTTSTASGAYGAAIGMKVDQPSKDDAGFTTWNASGKSVVGFAVTISGMSGGSVLDIKFPTTTDIDSTKDTPAVTVPGVNGTSITYNALFSDAVLQNNPMVRMPVDPSVLTDVQVSIPPDSIAHTYNYCITKIVPLMAAPNPVVPTGSYGPTWTNNTGQAVNGVNGYTVQNAPFPGNGNPMTMQVSATSGGVGFTFTPGSGFATQGSGPGSFPAIVSGWGPGEKGVQFYGPYQGGKTISALKSVPTSWSFSMGGSGDAAYDVWFGNSAMPATPGVELMVWIGNSGKQALGCCNAAGAALNGWTPYTGTNTTGQAVVSYVPSSSANSTPGSFDLLPYFQDAASHGYAGLSNSWYLLGVQAGFEVYGGSTWTTSNYNITIN